MRVRLLVLHPRESRPHEPKFQELLDRLNAQVAEQIELRDWQLDLMASESASLDEHLAALDAADAVIVMGGEDVEPSYYGGAPSYEDQTSHAPEADAVQLQIMRLCIARRVPLLGICRGHQLLNVACGGNLTQHMTEPPAHRKRATGDMFLGVDVITRADTDLAASIPAQQSVQCAHHQAIDQLGDGLVVAATAPDGTIEAVIHKAAPATGVQWHPEHPETANEQLSLLLGRLEAQASARSRDDVAVEAALEV